MNEKKDSKIWFPLLVLRDVVIMPGQVVSLDVKNEKSITGVEMAYKRQQELFVSTAKAENIVENVSKEQLFPIGVFAEVNMIQKIGNGVVRIMLSSKHRGKLSAVRKADSNSQIEISKDSKKSKTYIADSYYEVTAVNIKEKKSLLSKEEERAYIREICSMIKKFSERPKLRQGALMDAIQREKNLNELINRVQDVLQFSLAAKIDLLTTTELSARAEKTLQYLNEELSIDSIRGEIKNKLQESVSRNQREYVLREQLKLIHRELGDVDTEDESERYFQLLEEADPPKEVREKLKKEIKRFGNLSYSSAESAVLRNYIETLLEYPWNRAGIDNDDFNGIIEKLEKDHYGLKKIKERIIDYMAVRTLSDRRDAPILCLVGPPGTGKTSIARSIAEALNKKYGRIALGGVRDEAEIRGHRKTYIGAMPGRIVTVITKAGVNNPLILLDEIDKTGADHRGDTASALLEVLDGEQNVFFTDHYFEVPVDLSHVLFVATANDVSEIPEPLRDRMEIIEVNSYTENEKFHIAKLYLLPKQLKKNGLKKSQFKISDEAIYELIRHYTKESGVRHLEQLLGQLMQKTARGILTNEYKSLKVTPKKVIELLGVWKYSEDDVDLDHKVGIVNGLAWTKYGGDTLKIEVNLLEGKGDLTLTGNLGDVMKESAKIALSCVRNIPEIKKLPDDYFEKHIIHVHVPEGATPKDGPSAGITMALAIYSSLLNREVDGELAMTGEITLKGNVLPIGGLKEKLLAAKNAGMKRVLVPEKNRKNVTEIEDEIKEGLEIIYVNSFNEVISNGIIKRSFTLRQN